MHKRTKKNAIKSKSWFFKMEQELDEMAIKTLQKVLERKNGLSS